MIVAIVIGVVLVGLVVLMLWADRRDRAKGHVNRGIGEIQATIRADRMNIRNLRRVGGYGAVSPHQVRDRERREMERRTR